MRQSITLLMILLAVGNVIIAIDNANARTANEKSPALTRLKETMTKGNLKERVEALRQLVSTRSMDPQAFDIVAIELKNRDYINAIREATTALMHINAGRAITLLKRGLKDNDYNRRLDILFGLADSDTPAVLRVVDGYLPKNRREEVVLAFIRCRYGIDYKQNFATLTRILLDREFFEKAGEGMENYGAWTDAASYMGDLGDQSGLPALKKALEWADGAFGETIAESIRLLDFCKFYSLNCAYTF